MAVSSPLMEESIEGATGMLLNFTGSEDLNLFEVHEAADIVVVTADKGANIIFGTVIDPTMADEVRVTVIATGFEGFETLARRPIQVRDRARRRSVSGLGDRERRELQVSDDDIDVPSFLRAARRRARQPPASTPLAGRVWRGRPPALKRTPLYDAHVAAGRAGSSPSPAGRCRSSTRACVPSTSRCARAAASSTSPTWARSRPPGPQAEALLQRLLSNDVSQLEVGGAQYSVLCREDGGILDDLFTYRLAEERYLTVTNAANHERDLAWFASTRPTSTPRSPTRSALRDARRAGAAGALDRRRAWPRASCRRACARRR